VDGYQRTEWRLTWEQLDGDQLAWLEVEQAAPSRGDLEVRIAAFKADDTGLFRNVELYECTLTYKPTKRRL
jgi:hypothetical protein